MGEWCDGEDGMGGEGTVLLRLGDASGDDGCVDGDDTGADVRGVDVQSLSAARVRILTERADWRVYAQDAAGLDSDGLYRCAEWIATGLAGSSPVW